jgi:hypothetical protein
MRSALMKTRTSESEHGGETPGTVLAVELLVCEGPFSLVKMTLI